MSASAAPTPFVDIVPTELPYARCYCEENVWWLCRRLLDRSDVAPAYCLFISNPDRRVLMLRQQAGDGKRGGLIVWDYHVVALAAVTPPASDSATAASWYVLDVDSALPFPCPLATYLAASFPPGAAAPLLPLFRLVPAAAYSTHFASDRGHMRREDGSWYEPPPSWPAIKPADTHTASNIQAYISMQHPRDTRQQEEEQQVDEEQYGRVLTMLQLIDALATGQCQLGSIGASSAPGTGGGGGAPQ